MANLGVESTDRGQLLLVAAIGLAILLTALAMTLNTAVFADVNASKAADSLNEKQDAIEYQESVHRAVAGMLTSDAGETMTPDELATNIETWNQLISPEYARDGVATDALLVGTTTENRIVQNETRVYEDYSGETDWTLASNASDVEAYEMEVQADQLNSTADCASSGDCFALVVEGDDGGEWSMYVFSSPGNETVEIDVERADGNNGGECTADASSTHVNVTSGEFTEEDGTICQFDSFLEDGSLEAPYTIRYENADSITGMYNLSVTGDVVDGTVENDLRYDTTDSPRIEPVVVDATVSVRYHSPDLTYETEIRVVPSDADG